MKPVDIVYVLVFSIMIFSTVLWILAYLRNREEVRGDPEPSEMPSVTYLVPAYNEEDYIAKTIRKLLGQDYPEDKLNVIAINDGSEDGTLEEMKKFKDRIQIIDKENTGKANSMNYALQQVQTDLVGCMDGDSYPEKDMTKKMVGYFHREGVKGVTPALKVRKTDTWVQKIIWTEYVYQIFLRKIFALFNAQYVMPGPGSLYDTDYLKELGGWDEETLTEDMEIAFRMFENGARIENSTNAYVDTESPETLRGLFRQRIRWYRGYINNFLEYRNLLFRLKHGNLGFFFMPFNALWTFLLMFMMGHFLLRAYNGVMGAIQYYSVMGQIPLGIGMSIHSLSLFHVFNAVIALAGLTMIAVSVKTAGEEFNIWQRKLHYGLFLVGYALLYAGFWIAAILEELKGGEFRW
ncbi:MAG: glycosyltransferase family 2 protein [Candidatus Nanohaloarchaea archaeon]